jgi:hypothetical protein
MRFFHGTYEKTPFAMPRVLLHSLRKLSRLIFPQHRNQQDGDDEDSPQAIPAAAFLPQRPLSSLND